MKMKVLLFSLILFFYNLNVQAFDIRNINQSKIVSQASYKVNDTNLVDDENAENILDNVRDLNEALSEKQKEIQNNNKKLSLLAVKFDLYGHFSAPFDLDSMEYQNGKDICNDFVNSLPL